MCVRGQYAVGAWLLFNFPNLTRKNETDPKIGTILKYVSAVYQPYFRPVAAPLSPAEFQSNAESALVAVWAGIEEAEGGPGKLTWKEGPLNY